MTVNRLTTVASRSVLAAAALALLSACGGGSVRCETNPAYAQTERLPDLIAPDGLNKPPQDKAMEIPGEERLAYADSNDPDRYCIKAPPALPTVEVKRDRRAEQAKRAQDDRQRQ